MQKHGDRFEYEGHEYMAINGDGCEGCTFNNGGACMSPETSGDLFACYDDNFIEGLQFIEVDPNAIEREYTLDELKSALGLASYDVLMVDGRVLL